jgi:hypothetical protein
MYAMDIITGKTCEQCGYDLTGLEPEGLCPECGAYRDAWSGKGIATRGAAQQLRGDRIVRVFQVLGLLFLAALSIGLGAMYSWKSGSYSPLVLTGLVSLMFLVSAVFAGLSVWRH